MNKLDDMSFIRQFVQGKIQFEFNQNLKVEPCSDTIQLLTKRGILLATTKISHHGKLFLVREEPIYWEKINQVMLEHCMMPNGLNERGLIEYKFTSIPIGLQINYGVGRVLWTDWSLQVNNQSNTKTKLNFLISTPDGWEPLMDMACSQDRLFIKTSVDELIVNINEKVTWLSPKVEGSLEDLAVETENKSENNFTTSDILSASIAEDILLENSPSSSANFASKDISNNSFVKDNNTLQASTENHISSDISTPRTSAQNIVSIYQGKLYIQTIEGEIVVEGANMRFWFTPPQGSNISPQPVDVK